MIQQRLVLVAEPTPLREVTASSLQAIPGVEVICAEDLSSAQNACRHGGVTLNLSLVMVELQRMKGNGFSLAAALSRDFKCPVLLLSDRNDEADWQWCRSRGISGCLSRLKGRQAFLEAVSRMLEVSLAELAESPESRSNSGSNIATSTTILPENRRQSCHAHARSPRNGRLSSESGRNKSRVAKRARARLAEILSEVLYRASNPEYPTSAPVMDSNRLSQPAIAFIVGLLDHELRMSMFPENPPKELTPEDYWKCYLVVVNPPAALHHPARQLQRGVKFILAWQSAEVLRNTLLQGLRRMIQDLESPGCQRVALHILSIAISIQLLNPRCLPLRWLSELPALITYLSASRHGLMQRTHSALSWFVFRVGLGQCNGALAENRHLTSGLCSGKLITAGEVDTGDGIWRRLQVRSGTKASSEELICLLASTEKFHLEHEKMTDRTLAQLCLRLCHATYQMMICVQFQPDEGQSATVILNENLLVRSLYQASRSLIWHNRKGKVSGCQSLLALLRKLREGRPGLVMASLCLEIRLQEAVRLTSVQQRLAGGLHLLPRPDLVATSLLHSKSETSVLVSDLQSELDCLVTDAEQLGVTWVGALAYALLQALQLEASDFHNNSRRQIIRGLYRLCRMLDQAAAWQTVSAATGTVNRLLHIKYGKGASAVAEKMPAVYLQTSDSNEKYLKCLRLNQLIRKVVEEQKLQSGAASTLGRLISEQQRLLSDAFSP